MQLSRVELIKLILMPTVKIGTATENCKNKMI